MVTEVSDRHQINVDRDFFTDRSVLVNPYGFLKEMRDQAPVGLMSNRDVVIVTGFAEAVEVLLNTADFSAVLITAGPTAPLPFEPQGSDISDQIEAHRKDFIGSDQFISYDGEQHAACRSLLSSLFTPSRLRANEEYMERIAAEMIGEAVAKGESEIVRELATPYVTLVIADLLGVPDEDRLYIQEVLEVGPTPGSMDDADGGSSLDYMGVRARKLFDDYFEERRANPRGDVMSMLATAKFPDGSTPETSEVVTLAMFLFSAGQDTSAKLLGNSVRYLCENPDLQSKLRAEPELIANFIEEMLRMEGSSKNTFRLAKRDTKIGDMEIPAGTKVCIALSGANRDPRRWEDPNSLKLDRPKMKEHLGFARGAHTCIGAPLARAEVRVILEQLITRTSDISISDEHHGPANARTLEYEASYIIRGLEELHVKLKPR